MFRLININNLITAELMNGCICCLPLKEQVNLY